jgi:type IV secretory pathway TrbL component
MISLTALQMLPAWAGTIQNYATWIFWSLAVISMVWTFAMMAMQGEGLSAALAEVVRFFAVLGFFFYLLKRPGNIGRYSGFITTTRG